MRIAVTRVAGKGARDAGTCRKHGHECSTVSPLRVEIYHDRVDSFLEAANRGELDCIFFASAVPAELLGPRLRDPPRVIAIGPQTARTLEKHGIRCETLPAFYSRDLVPYLGDWIRGKRIGIPRADVPNPALLGAIGAAGGIPVEVRVYGLIPTREPLPGLLLMAIGDITAGVMRAAGAEPAVVGDGSLEGTLVALNRFLGKGGRGSS
jgi:uroporphyrinogen-III synthase